MVDQVVSAIQTTVQTYLVQEGDTLSSIASATDLTAEEIAAANKIDDIHFIVVGPTIELTGAPVEVATEPAQVGTPSTEAAPVVTEEVAPVVETAAPAQEAPVAEVTPSYNTDMAVNGASTYPAGQYTWFVKNALPWVRNYWGNAADWGQLSNLRWSLS